MKTRLVVLLGLLLAAPFWSAAGQYATKTSKADADKEEEATIAGIAIERKNGQGYLGLEIVDYNYKLTFYDKDKKPTPADFPRALFRWSARGKSGDARYMLKVGSDANVLTSSRYVRPPYNFRLFIVLLDDDPDTPSEAYAVRVQL